MWVTASSLSCSASVFSAWVMTSYMTVTMTLSLWKVVAVFGPRPSWALWIPTMALVIAAFSSPPLSVG